MTALPYGPCYYGDALALFTLTAWGPDAQGIWFNLRARQWMEGTIPADLETLVRMTGGRARVVEMVVSRCYPLTSDGSARQDPALAALRSEKIEAYQRVVDGARNGGKKSQAIQHSRRQRPAQPPAPPSMEGSRHPSRGPSTPPSSKQTPPTEEGKPPLEEIPIQAPPSAPWRARAASPMDHMTVPERQDYLRAGFLAVREADQTTTQPPEPHPPALRGAG